MVDETMLLHTLDTEAYEAALDAAKKSLEESDCNTPGRLARLAGEEGVVGEAARSILETA